MSDHELLRHYARARDQAAFAALVDRHLALVYSAARRQVRSSHLAEEVAQSVFLDLAQRAAVFPADQSLVAWLHVVTRRTAIDVVRRESRRQAREHAAAELADPVKPTPDPWSEIEPLLDEAVETLREPDRTAILLRFFQNQDLREIGAALGISDDAAQKRITRALDQLRTFFLRRGLTVTTAGLATDLSAHAITAIPAVLGPGIVTSAAAVATTATVSAGLGSATSTILMTTLQKSLVTGALVLSGGAGLYEAATLRRQDSDLALLQSKSSALQADLEKTRLETDASSRRLAAVESEIDARLRHAQPPAPGSDAALEQQIKTWLAGVRRLKDFAAQHPELACPELRLLSDDLWAEIIGQAPPNPGLDSDAGARSALVSLRKRAEGLMGQKLSQALSAYVNSTSGLLPDTLPQLLPYFDPPIAPDLLSRYELLRTGRVSDLSPVDRHHGVIATASVIDPDQDFILRIGPSGLLTASALQYDVEQAQQRYTGAHHGERATTADQLSPYLRWADDPAHIQRLLQRRPASAVSP